MPHMPPPPDRKSGSSRAMLSSGLITALPVAGCSPYSAAGTVDLVVADEEAGVDHLQWGENALVEEAVERHA